MMTIAPVEMTKEQRRELRRKLEAELVQVQRLYPKIDARMLQIKQSHFALGDTMQREVTSHVYGTPSDRTGYQMFRPYDDSTLGSQLPSSKRKPKANQLYNKTDFIVGKDKIPPPVKSKVKPGSSKRNAPSTNGGDRKRKAGGLHGQLLSKCKSILKTLMDHPDGWVFQEPVDAVKLKLPDYHTIITKPMDLGTIKGKLNKKAYAFPQQFAEDVRLTFKNAMTYNPPGNDVHEMACQLSSLFERDWKLVSDKIERADGESKLHMLNRLPTQVHQSPNVDKLAVEGLGDQHQSNSNKKGKKSAAFKPQVPARQKAPPKPKNLTAPKAGVLKKEMDLVKLKDNLEKLPLNMLESIIKLVSGKSPNANQNNSVVEVELTSFDSATLVELDRQAKICLRKLNRNRKAVQGQNQLLPSSNIEKVEESQKAAVIAQEEATPVSSSSSSSSSSSESGSSSDSDSDSSSSSGSDADDVGKS